MTNLPDVTTKPAEWEIESKSISPSGEERNLVWRNKVHPNVYSTDGGKTYTISTERIDPTIPREVRESRKV